MLITLISDKRGQVSLEYLTTLGIILIIVGILAGYAFVMYNETIALHDIETSAQELKNGIATVHALGEGNSVVVEITIPNDVSSITFTNTAILITHTSFGSSTTDTIETDANISGSINTTPGTHDILIKSVNGAVTLNEA